MVSEDSPAGIFWECQLGPAIKRLRQYGLASAFTRSAQAPKQFVERHCRKPLLTFQDLPPAHSASASYVGFPVAAAALMSMQLVESLAQATTSIVRAPTSAPVFDRAKGTGRMELQKERRRQDGFLGRLRLKIV